MSKIVYGNKLFMVLHKSEGRLQKLECGVNYVKQINFKSILLCFDLDTQKMLWQKDVSCDNCYRVGELEICDDLLTCYGCGRLLFIEPETGDTAIEISLPRINKLYCPIRLDNGDLIIGYTNWTAAGVLRYDSAKKKVLWKNNMKFQGPELRCFVGVSGDIALWSKNDTEIIAVDIHDGNVRYRLRTEPWLYTTPKIEWCDLIYGTSGGDGYINSVNISNGEKNWSVFLRNGCAFYDVYKNTLLTGDFENTIKQIRISDGKIMQNYNVDGAVVGQIKVDDKFVYTVVIVEENECALLLKIKI